MAAFHVAHLLLLFSITISLHGSVHGQTVVLLNPIKNGPVEAGLIVVPGAELRGETYEPLAAQIQEASPLKLHVALTTDYLNDTPNPIQVSHSYSSFFLCPLPILSCLSLHFSFPSSLFRLSPFYVCFPLYSPL